MGLNFLDLLLPREVEFFKHMNNQVDNFCEACVVFRDLIAAINKNDYNTIHAKVSEIKDFELRGDRIERFIINKLDKTFITPLDREDIHSIVLSVDASMDILNNISQKIEIYKIRNVPKNVKQFTTIMVDISIELQKLIRTLENKEDIELLVGKIHKLENDADCLFHNSMAELFEDHTAIEIIKFKEIYERLEDVINSVEHIAKLIRGIKVKQG